MTGKRVVAVAGATGAQGGGVVRAILHDRDGQYSARALTRDPNSDKARKLADLGAAVVRADLHDPESVRKADEGAPAGDRFPSASPGWQVIDGSLVRPRGTPALGSAKASYEYLARLEF